MKVWSGLAHFQTNRPSGVTSNAVMVEESVISVLPFGSR